MQKSSAPHLSLSDKDLFLKELKTVTAPAHKRLEEIPLSKAIVSPQISMVEYGLYLAKMRAFVKSFEHDLFPLLQPVFSDIDTRRKTAWLENDLEVLTDMGVQIPQIPVFSFKSQLPEAFLAGAMYVLEGSTLGGKFIYKNIYSSLSLSVDHGATYFGGYGENTGKQWNNFLETLCNYASAENRSEIFRGADETFKLMFELLSR